MEWVRRWQSLNNDDVGKPTIEVAAMALASSTRFWMSELSEDPIVVVQQETRLLVEGGKVTDLVFDPFERRISGGIEVDDAPRLDLHDHEYVDDSEEGGVLNHEVAGEDFLTVIPDKGSPGLPIAPPAWFDPCTFESYWLNARRQT